MQLNILKHQLKELGQKPLVNNCERFGLVVIGAHFGIWLNDKILEYKNTNILLVEPVPYNYKILKIRF